MNWKVVEKGNNLGALIKVIGVGGCGGNAVDHMVCKVLKFPQKGTITYQKYNFDSEMKFVK